MGFDFCFSFELPFWSLQQGSLKIMFSADEMGEIRNSYFCFVSHQGHNLIILNRWNYACLELLEKIF